jgi:PEP-CTERM motif-containing protein
MKAIPFRPRSVSHSCAWGYLSIICAAIALAIAYTPGSQAQTFFPPAVSLTSLTNGGVIIVGDKAFSDFGVSGDPFASNITVEGIEAGGDFGIQFGGTIASSLGNPMDLTLMYQVSVTNSANLISGANLSFNGTVNPPGSTGFATVVEQIFTNNGVNPYGQMSVSVNGLGQGNLSTNMVITPPQPLLDIDKDVEVDAFLPADSSISTINQTFTQVPEPSTMMLAIAGLSGLFLLRRRRR